MCFGVLWGFLMIFMGPNGAGAKEKRANRAGRTKKALEAQKQRNLLSLLPSLIVLSASTMPCPQSAGGVPDLPLLAVAAWIGKHGSEALHLLDRDRTLPFRFGTGFGADD